MATVKVAGKEVTVHQKPFIEADASRAQAILAKLLSHSSSEVSSTARISKVSED